MKKRTIIYLVILVTLINVSALGTIVYLRQQPPVPCPPGSGFEIIKKEAELTPSQIEQFQVYRRMFHSELDSLDQLLVEERRKLAAEIRKDEPDNKRIRDIITRIGDLQQESQYKVLDHFFRIKKILPPEQEEIFFNIVLERFISKRQFPGARHFQRKNNRPKRR